MPTKRGGLLVLLAAALLLATAAWTTASARELPVPDTVWDSGGMTRITVLSPASGEPDVGGTPRSGGESCSLPKGGADGEALPGVPRSWIGRVLSVWRVWFLGLS